MRLLVGGYLHAEKNQPGCCGYDPFWRTLKDRGISTYKMINKLGYSSSTLYRLRHNKGISSRLIDDLCKLLVPKDLLAQKRQELLSELREREARWGEEALDL
mgnify:CR=1 FL=1